jgi:ubiquitin C-terminal hydrolase
MEKMFCLKSGLIIHCSACGHKCISNPGPQQILNLPLQRHASNLDGHIDQHFAVDILDDYRCDSCKKVVQNSKSTQIKRFPEVLCVQLNRIEYNPRNGRQIVNHREISIPTTLDMARYKSKKSTEPSQQPSRKVEYELLSVIKHHGSVSSGHYICGAVGSDGKWNIFDDKSVTQSSAKQATSKAHHFDPFMMYYQMKRD